MHIKKANLSANKIRTILLIKIDNEIKNKKSLILFPQKSEEIEINYVENFSSANLKNNNDNFCSDNFSSNSLSTCADSHYLSHFKKETSLEVQKFGKKILREISTKLKKSKKMISKENILNFNYINEKINFN